VRVLEEVSSVVLVIRGLLRPTTPKPNRSWCFSKQPAQNLRNTPDYHRGSHEISLSLVSQGKSDRSEPVDYVLNCERRTAF